MKSEILAHLHDIRQAGQAVRDFVAGRSFEDYRSDELLRSGVERKFEIMGEALTRIARDDAAVLEQIRDYRDIIAGPNGAGKTTFAREFLPREAECPAFINVDLIAAGLSPFDPESANLRAGRFVLQEIHRRIRLGESFAIETTLSGRSYAAIIPRWRSAGYSVQLIFLALPTADLAIARVSARVAQGGHGVEEGVLRRRFGKGLHNFHTFYRGLVNSWALYDNSGSIPRLIDSGDNP